MKYFRLLALLVSLQALAVEITLDDVAKHVSKKNYVVLQNAQLTYQSHEAVSFARNNLLPQLNVWSAVGIVFSWTSVLGLIPDIAPFLIPANWFRIKEQKILFEAQKYGYHAVWANQIALAKALFYRLDFDTKLLSSIGQNIKELEVIHSILKTMEIFGTARVGESKLLELRILELQEDERRVKYLLEEEKAQLKYILALKAEEEVSIKPLHISMENRPYLDFSKLYLTAVNQSPEIKQFKEFIKVVPQIKKEVRFSFLGTSSISRGVGGGIFDDVPIQHGLGFGAGNTIAILRSKEVILKLQLKGIEETIKNQLKIMVDIYNSDLDYYHTLTERIRHGQLLYHSFFERLQMGESINPWDIVEASRSMIGSQMELNSLMARFLDTSEKIERNLMAGDYASLPDFEKLLKAASEK